MARTTHKLAARTVATLTKPGLHGDGAGLYLRVEKPAKPGEAPAKRWVFIYKLGGKRREMGLGSAASTAVGLAEAREAASAARKHVRDGVDPVEARKTAREEAARPKIGNTFGEVADAIVEEKVATDPNGKGPAAWRMTLRDYAKPLRGKPVDEITTDDVLAVLKSKADPRKPGKADLEPLWTRVPETASRLRGRIEHVLDVAKVRGLRTGENPARWRGHLALLLSPRQELTRGHHAALSYTEVGEFMQRLRARPEQSAKALELLILTAARTGELIRAEWSEFDLGAGVWTRPAAHTKTRLDHRVPLSTPAVALMRSLHREGVEGYVFPGSRARSHMSNMAMAELLKRMGLPNVTVHGFRSSFRDWVSEVSSFPDRLAEQALGHVVGSRVERAYMRMDALERRRPLMESWATFVSQPAGANVKELRPAVGITPPRLAASPA